jgi:hypothetical protein
VKQVEMSVLSSDSKNNSNVKMFKRKEVVDIEDEEADVSRI